MSRAGAVGRRRDPAAASRGVVVPFGELGRSSVKKLPSRERVYRILMGSITIVTAAKQAKDPDDHTLILADVGRKAIWQVERFVQELLERYMKSAQAKEVARILSTGTWTHDHPLSLEELEALGFLVKVGVPRGVRELMRLYPQPQGRQASVEYVPSPRQPREIP